MMKKVFALLLAALMLFSLAACAGTEPVTTDAPSTAAPETTTAPETEAPATEAPTEPETEAPTEQAVLTDEEQAIYDLLFGAVDGEYYNSPMLGLRFRIPDGWTVFGQTENLENNGFVADGTLIEQIAAAPMVMLMLCSNEESGSSVNITVENIPEGMTEEEYITTQLESTKAAMSQLGFENVETSAETTMLAGAEHFCMQVKGEVGGMLFHETLVAFAMPDNSMALITSSSFDAEEPGMLIGSFENIPA